MVLTQTCDIVRDMSMKPFVEVCPVVEVAEGALREIERGRRPGYAFIPTLADRRLVADLDRVMTVEKGALVDWSRVEGWTTDAQARQLALALSRKRARVAFPDDFVRFVNPLMKKVSDKHDRQSDEGQALRGLRELRVRAAPSWNADEVTLTFWFIRSDVEAPPQNQRWGCAPGRVAGADPGQWTLCRGGWSRFDAGRPDRARIYRERPAGSGPPDDTRGVSDGAGGESAALQSPLCARIKGRCVGRADLAAPTP
jgi:hypothetical protein